MKIYYRLQQSLSDSYRITSKLGLPKLPSGHTTSLNAGREILFEIPPLFRFDVGGLDGQRPRHFLEGAGILVISGLFLRALKQADVKNFQAFPTILRDPKTEQEWNGYHAFNEIGTIAAALLDECKYSVLAKGGKAFPPLFEFNEIVLSEKKLNECLMFRMEQDPNLLFISEEVMETLRKFSPPEKWGITTKKVEAR
jgi:hypothetical protein